MPLFSAAVAALLAVTVQDLRPNSQDTSAFYLGNIYQVLADPNVTLSSTPVAKPPSFSRLRYEVSPGLGELSLVLEPGHEPQLCSVSDIFASMGASIYPSDSTFKMQSRKTSANACILCQRSGEDAYPVGS